MDTQKITRTLLIIVVVLACALGGGLFYVFQTNGLNPVHASAEPSASASALPSAAAEPSPSAEPSASAGPSASAEPSATPTVTPKPTPSPTPSPTPTPTPQPQAVLTLGSTDVSSINGAEAAVTVSASDGTTITVTTSTSNIAYWLDPGTLYIYPQESGTVTVTASGSAYQSVSQTINVTYVVQAIATPDTSTSDSGVLTPTLTRGSDLSFWFRSGSGMDGTKDYFFDYASSYGVDPWLCIAIACHETGYGVSDACNSLNNFGGLMDSSGNLKSYDSKAQGVEALVWLINWYKNQGRTTIEQIGEWYCPGQGWIGRVTTIYNSFHQ